MTETMPSAVDPGHVTTLVTVTYADRIGYLRELLQRAFVTESIVHAVVVSNASKSDFTPLEKQWGERLRIVRLDSNTGSANAYAVGIKTALDSGSTYIWLMDDDNAPKPGALAVLHRALAASISSVGAGNAAVLGFRPDHQADVAEGIAQKWIVPPHSSFFGFHYRQIFFKIRRRIMKQESCAVMETVSLAYAPYGGLLAARALFERIGLPKRDLILYGDDTEYTRRITANGGSIKLITAAKLEDLEGSWGLKKKYANSFIAWLCGGADFRVFYTARNQAWFDRHVWTTSILDYRINQIIFFILLKYFSLRTGNRARLHLLYRAIRNGQASSLGMDPEFPLK